MAYMDPQTPLKPRILGLCPRARVSSLGVIRQRLITPRASNPCCWQGAEEAQGPKGDSPKREKRDQPQHHHQEQRAHATTTTEGRPTPTHRPTRGDKGLTQRAKREQGIAPIRVPIRGDNHTVRY